MSPLQEAGFAYRADPSDLNRNRLLEEVRPMVCALAHKLWKRLPFGADLDLGDLIQEGLIAVIKTFPRWDPDRGGLSTFLPLRVAGAMKDALREMDIVPRLERTRGSKVVCMAFSTLLPDGVREPRFMQFQRDPGDDVVTDDFWKEHLKGCDQRERLMMLMLYREGLTMREIGHSLGCSESRISQMHSEVLRRLKLRAPSLAN